LAPILQLGEKKLTTIEKELKKILGDQCPVENIQRMFESANKEEFNPEIILWSIDILKMHEQKIRRIRQNLELMYKSKVIERYVNKKKY
jgi:hypothetical protein